MTEFPFRPLIERYFPPKEWEAAECIIRLECPDLAPDCIKEEGLVECLGSGLVRGRSYGLFGILDICWAPGLTAITPFSPAHWDQVLDPNVNTWMASVIWSRHGWGAWSSCSECPTIYCQDPGGPIPYPQGPVVQGTAPWVLVGAAVVGAVALLVAIGEK